MERGAAVAAVVAGLALGCAPFAELAGTNRGDTDSARDGLAFLRESGPRYGLAGFLMVVGGIALVVAVVGLARMLRSTGELSLGAEVVTVLGLIGGGCYVFAGLLRHTSHGTIGYIEGMDRDWAEAAYLAVHMIGTQGLLPMAAHLLAAWLVLIAVVAIRRGVRWLSVIGILPAFLLVLYVVDALVPAADDSAVSGAVWFVYVFAMLLAQPLALVAVGLVALRPAVRDRLAAPVAIQGSS
jgi:hypothetical protein